MKISRSFKRLAGLSCWMGFYFSFFPELNCTSLGHNIEPSGESSIRYSCMRT